MTTTILITLTLDNGNTREVQYEVAGDRDRAQILFETLRDTAWAASVYVQPEPCNDHAACRAINEWRAQEAKCAPDCEACAGEAHSIHFPQEAK